MKFNKVIDPLIFVWHPCWEEMPEQGGKSFWKQEVHYFNLLLVLLKRMLSLLEIENGFVPAVSFLQNLF